MLSILFILRACHAKAYQPASKDELVAPVPVLEAACLSLIDRRRIDEIGKGLTGMKINISVSGVDQKVSFYRKPLNRLSVFFLVGFHSGKE